MGIKLYTGYFSHIYKYKGAGLVPVSIARYSPKGCRGYGMLELSPTSSLLERYKVKAITSQQYKEEYLNYLDTCKWNSLLKRLEVMGKGGTGVVLCCYEKPLQFCHRHILAEYLTESGYPTIEAVIVGKDTEIIP